MELEYPDQEVRPCRLILSWLSHLRVFGNLRLGLWGICMSLGTFLFGVETRASSSRRELCSKQGRACIVARRQSSWRPQVPKVSCPQSMRHRFTQHSDHIQKVTGSFALSCNFLRTLTRTDHVFQSGLSAAVGNCREVRLHALVGMGKDKRTCHGLCATV